MSGLPKHIVTAGSFFCRERCADSLPAIGPMLMPEIRSAWFLPAGG